MAYWVCIAQAMLISLISLAYRVYEWWAQVRTRICTARNSGIETQPTRRETLLAKIVAAKKTCIAHILAFLVAVFEDIPMGTLTVIFTVRIYNLPIMLVLSLVTSCIMLGMKLNKLTLLKHWCAMAAFCLHCSPSRRLVLFSQHGCRWDKSQHWKSKLDEEEMDDAVPSSGATESACDLCICRNSCNVLTGMCCSHRGR